MDIQKAIDENPRLLIPWLNEVQAALEKYHRIVKNGPAPPSGRTPATPEGSKSLPEVIPERTLTYPSTRRLTIHSKRDRSKGSKPALTLSGSYLESYGFDIGKNVTVLMEEGKITLTIDGQGPK